MYKRIITVDENDEVVGSEETIQEAIDKGLFRRIARVFVFDTEMKVLIQRRSSTVRHPLLLDQSVGGHVDEGETYEDAAIRETKEELGLEGYALTEVAVSHKEHNVFSAIYKITVPVGIEIMFDVGEVDSVYWMSVDEVNEQVSASPEQWTIGFVNVWKRYRDTLIA
jgi:16S rRNA (adenine1518-N6/adenine1519-N6)-dimethyltransferase